ARLHSRALPLAACRSRDLCRERAVDAASAGKPSPCCHARAPVGRSGIALMAITAHPSVSPATHLKLGRVSNLPTVWTNVLAGTILGGGDAGNARTVLVALAMSMFYVGGMYLNDYCDRHIDARERPERPIPRGEISQTTVAVIGYALLFAGIALMAAFGVVAVASLALAAAIIAYDWFHK